MTSNPPTRHHYIPQFYLKCWAGTDGLVNRYAIENGKVKMRRQSPRSIGFQENLYRAPQEHLTEWQAQTLETHFFGPIDSLAAKALRRLLIGDLNLDGWLPEERQGWVMFVRSLMIRSPEGVAAAKSRLRVIFEATLKELKTDYDFRRTAADPETFAQFKAMLHPYHPERAAMQSIAHTIGSETVGQRILDAQWAVVDVAGSPHRLLMSDAKPAHIGLDLPNGHIMLPVSPNKIFVAATDMRFLKALRETPESDLVHAMNRRTVGEATRFVVSSDAHQSRFIENRMGSDVIASSSENPQTAS